MQLPQFCSFQYLCIVKKKKKRKSSHLLSPQMVKESESVSSSVLSDSLRLHGLGPPRFPCPWDSPGKNTGVGSHSLLQGIFLTRGSNPGLLHCRQILYCLSHLGSPHLKWQWLLIVPQSLFSPLCTPHESSLLTWTCGTTEDASVPPGPIIPLPVFVHDLFLGYFYSQKSAPVSLWQRAAFELPETTLLLPKSAETQPCSVAC